MGKSLEDILNNIVEEKQLPKKIQKILDNGMIQEVSERNGYYIMFFSFQVKGKHIMEYMSRHCDILMLDEEYKDEIYYIGAAIVDKKCMIQRAILESYIIDTEGNIELNATQLLTKSDGIVLDELFKDKYFDELILPICKTDMSTAWKDSITNYHYGYPKGDIDKPYYDYSTYYGVMKDIYTFIMRHNFTSIESIEKNIHSEVNKQAIVTKLNCASIIAKAIERSGEKISTSISDGSMNIALSNIHIGSQIVKAGTRVANGYNGKSYAYGDK